MAKILLVEDDKSLREIYGVRLQAEGYTIISAGDGEEALAVAIKERPDLIVSDVMMPKISGFDMLDILRSTTETKDIKVIMMTALSSEDQRARGEALGADRYLVKSQVGIEDVVRTVHDVLGDGLPGATSATPEAPVATQAPVEPAPAPTPDLQSSAPTLDTPAVAAPAPIEPLATPPVAPTPVLTPDPVPAPAPIPEPTLAPEPAPAPNPVYAPAPVIPSEPIPTPVVTPAPLSTPFTPEPVPEPTPAPMSAPVVVVPEPVAPAPAPSPFSTPEPVSLPQPTAPFSSNPPAGLGDRIINPLPSADGLGAGLGDIASQMNQELNATSQPLTPNPVPAPAPQQDITSPQPPQPPLPPYPQQPGA